MSAAQEHAAIQVNKRARLEILAAIMLAQFLGALDQTIVGPVLPTITTDLGGADLYVWAVTSYLVTSTAAIPVYGKLSDFFGRKPMLIMGISLFLIGSALSGLSQDMWQLIAFRGIQGIGAGALFPISLAVIGDLFTPAERGKYQGLFGAVFGVAFLIGPFMGGFLTDNLSWHWIFYVNVPVGVISLYLIGKYLPTIRKEGAKFNLDIPGVAFFLGAIVPVLIALTNAESHDWLDQSVVSWFAVALVSFVAFLVAETRAEDPIIPLGLFRNRTFSVSALSSFLAVFGFATLIIFLPLWFRVVKGESTTAAGYLMFPFLFGLIFSSIASGQIISRTGRYKTMLCGSLVVMAIGLAMFSNLRGNTDFLMMDVWMLITGLGVGPTMATFTLIVQNDVPFDRLGTATSDLVLLRQIGTSVAMTVAFTLFRNNLSWDLIRGQIANNLPQGVPSSALPANPPAGFDPGALTSVGGSAADAFKGIPSALVPAVTAGFHDAFSIALANSVWIGVGAAVLSFVVALGLKEKPLRAHFHAEQLERSGVHSIAEEPAA